MGRKNIHATFKINAILIHYICLLEMPFYHPVIEEALQDALKQSSKLIEEYSDKSQQPKVAAVS